MIAPIRSRCLCLRVAAPTVEEVSSVLLAVLCVSIGLVVTTLASKLQKEEQDALAVADEAGWSIGVAEARAFLSALVQNAAEVGDVDPFKALRSDFDLGVCCMLGALLSRAVGGAVHQVEIDEERAALVDAQRGARGDHRVEYRRGGVARGQGELLRLGGDWRLAAAQEPARRRPHPPRLPRP